MFEQDYDRADRIKQRGYLMYARAERSMHKLFVERDAGIEKVLHGDPDELLAYLREEYDDPEEDVEMVLWWALTWGSTITNSPDFDSLIDLTTVKTLARHAMELDEGYENAGALALLGRLRVLVPGGARRQLEARPGVLRARDRADAPPQPPPPHQLRSDLRGQRSGQGAVPVADQRGAQRARPGQRVPAQQQGRAPPRRGLHQPRRRVVRVGEGSLGLLACRRRSPATMLSAACRL